MEKLYCGESSNQADNVGNEYQVWQEMYVGPAPNGVLLCDVHSWSEGNGTMHAREPLCGILKEWSEAGVLVPNGLRLPSRNVSLQSFENV